VSDDDEHCVVLSDGTCGITLHAPPSVDDYGFVHDVDVWAGSLRGSMSSGTFQNPYPTFVPALKKLYATLSGEVHLGRSYDNLDLVLKGDGRGHIQVAVTAILDQERPIKLEYRIFLDQTQLQTVICRIERVFAAP
jgi:hypothetical protein